MELFRVVPQFLALALACLLAAPAFAKPREIREMEAILGSVKPGSLVAFDLDNTVIWPDQTIGSDQWFDHLLHKFEAEGMSSMDAILRARREAAPVMMRSGYSLVEPRTAALIRELRNKGVKVIALTARNTGMVDLTMDHLAKVGVEFDGGILPEANLAEDGSALTRNGVVFSGHTPKGEVLERYLQEAKLDPERIVFIDDKLKNAAGLEEYFRSRGKDVVAFRYGKADEAVKAFDGRLADLQHAHFLRTGELLSDSRVQELFASGRAGKLAGRRLPCPVWFRQI